MAYNLLLAKRIKNDKLQMVTKGSKSHIVCEKKCDFIEKGTAMRKCLRQFFFSIAF